MLETVRKAGRVLDLYADGAAEWGVTEVADALDLPKSGAHSILSTLTDIGLLERTAEKRYRLGWQVVALSRVLLDTTALRSAAAPLMRHLTVKIRSSSHLAVVHQGRAMCIERSVAATAPPPTTLRVGEYLPERLRACALLADHGAPELPTFGRPLAAPPTSGHGAEMAVAAVERHCVAAPIQAYDGRVVAALGLSIPSSQITATAAHTLVLRIAERVSREVSALELAHW